MKLLHIALQYYIYAVAIPFLPFLICFTYTIFLNRLLNIAGPYFHLNQSNLIIYEFSQSRCELSFHSNLFQPFAEDG